MQLDVLMERCVWWRGSQRGRGDWRCVSVRGGALSVVMDGLTPTLVLSAMTSDMTSLVYIYNYTYTSKSVDSTVVFLGQLIVTLSFYNDC